MLTSGFLAFSLVQLESLSLMMSYCLQKRAMTAAVDEKQRGKTAGTKSNVCEKSKECVCIQCCHGRILNRSTWYRARGPRGPSV